MQIEIEGKEHWLAISRPFPGYKTSGVYFLFDGDELVYVGKSVNIANRIATAPHKFKWDKFAFIACGVDEMKWKEFTYIGIYRPRYNKGGNGRGPYTGTPHGKRRSSRPSELIESN